MSKRVTFLDALRGLAALVVVFQHCIERILAHGAAGSMAGPLSHLFIYEMNWGRFGVAAFFMLSGFVVPYSFSGETPRRRFIVSRIFRLYPAYWVSLLYALTIYALLAGKYFTPQTITANFLMLQSFVGLEDVVGAYWTLAIELMFYGLCFVLFCTGSLLNPKVLTAMIAFMILASTSMTAIGLLMKHELPVGIPLHIALMFTGTLLRLASFEHDRIAKRTLPWLLVLIVVTIPFIQFGGAEIRVVKHHLLQPMAFTIAYYLAITAFLVMVRFQPTPPKWLVWLGSISYSLYLLHGPSITAAEQLLEVQTPVESLVFIAIVVSSSVLLSALVYRLVERPGVKVGHRVGTFVDRISRGYGGVTTGSNARDGS